jgi:hypothetical protein
MPETVLGEGDRPSLTSLDSATYNDHLLNLVDGTATVSTTIAADALSASSVIRSFESNISNFRCGASTCNHVRCARVSELFPRAGSALLDSNSSVLLVVTVLSDSSETSVRIGAQAHMRLGG